ncbi:MAG: OmpH family outer membrane protein [Planctomycetota bacterium]
MISRLLRVCVLGIFCLGLGTLSGQARAEDATKRLAVVNVARVFKAYQKVEEVQERMRKAFEAELKALEKDGQELKKKQVDIETSTRNPQKDLAFFKEVQAFELAKRELENRYQNQYQRVEELKKSEMKEVLKDIKNAIRSVAAAEKCDLVLRAPEFENEFDPTKTTTDKDKDEKARDEAQTADELVRKFRENPVLFFATGVDITQKVIEKLNENYKGAAPK